MKLLKPFRNKDAWLAFFVLGIIMLNYPFIVICNKTTPVFGIPMLVLYFLVGWPLSIIVILIFSRSISENSGTHDPDDGSKRSGDET